MRKSETAELVIDEIDVDFFYFFNHLESQRSDLFRDQSFGNFVL